MIQLQKISTLILPHRRPTLGIDPPMHRLPETSVKQSAPKLSTLATQLAPPAFSVTEATPLAESPARGSLAQRKAPPRPLNLGHTREEQIQPVENTIQAMQQETAEDIGERGRRKTREDDDRDREVAVAQEQEARSRSKKEKRSKVDQSRGEEVQKSPGEVIGQHQTASPLQASENTHLTASAPTNDLVHRTLSGSEPRLLSPPLRSPGLPASPRPADRHSHRPCRRS